MFVEVRKTGYDEYKVTLADQTKEKIKQFFSWIWFAVCSFILACVFLGRFDKKPQK